MALNDGIIDPYARVGLNDKIKKFHSTMVKYNPKTIIYYNSDDVVLKVEEILYPGTDNEATYSQTFYYSNVTNSGIDHTTTIEPWVEV